MAGELVLVTGGSGFLGTHCVVQLLEAGHHVRTTVRSVGRADEVRAMVREGGVDPDALEFAEADLTQDDGWAEALKGADHVLHVASPFPVSQPDNEDDLIVPARDGTLRVLRAARDAGVKRVVLTSSFAAVGYGHPRHSGDFTETDWTDTSGVDVTPYVKSKTVAERAAWDYVEREGNGLELTVVNPVGIFGPILGSDLSTSVELLRRMVDGLMPRVPRVYTNIVDVRDVASLHLLAMTSPNAAGERFLSVAGPPMSFLEIGDVLRGVLGEAGSKIPTKQLPDWVVRVGARFNPALRGVAPTVGVRKPASNAKARRVLGWSPRSNDEAVTATALSLQQHGLL